MDLRKLNFGFDVLLLLLGAGSLGTVSQALCAIVSALETASYSSERSANYQQFTVLIW